MWKLYVHSDVVFEFAVVFHRNISKQHQTVRNIL